MGVGRCTTGCSPRRRQNHSTSLAPHQPRRRNARIHPQPDPTRMQSARNCRDDLQRHLRRRPPNTRRSRFRRTLARPPYRRHLHRSARNRLGNDLALRLRHSPSRAPTHKQNGVHILPELRQNALRLTNYRPRHKSRHSTPERAKNRHYGLHR